jgi:ATP-dependent Clp protease adaptor protein ClpS
MKHVQNNKSHNSNTLGEANSDAAIKQKIRIKKPSQYNVLLHNDDFTTMDFVVFVLKSIFQKSEQEAIDLMLEIHNAGRAICGVYSREIAETKVNEVRELALKDEFPLLCTYERA